LESYKKCVSVDPDCAAAHNNMGLIYVDKKDFEGAEKEFNEILRIFPGHPTGLKNLELARDKKRRGLRRFF
jgi:lipoprotein NlpI